MLVEGNLKCQIEINTEEAIKALYERFGIKYNDRYQYSIEERNGIKGIYRARDISYHGSPVYEYELLHKGETACKLFLSLKLLDTELEKTVIETKEAKKLEYIKNRR